MGTLTITRVACLIITVIAIVLALAGIASGYWLVSALWLLTAYVFGRTFVQNGKFTLTGNDDNTRIIVLPESFVSY